MILPFLAFLSATMIQNPAPAPPPALKDVRRIVCLGASITQFGEAPGGYVWLMRHYLQDLYPQQGFEVINAGVSGNKSNDAAARLQRDVLDKKPDMVTINLGLNDVWHGFDDKHPLGDGPGGNSLADYRQTMEGIVTKIQATGSKVVFLCITLIHENLDGPENKKAEGYNEALRDIARRHHIQYIDLQKPYRTLVADYQRTGGRDNFLTLDGVHMTPQGNAVMAHTILTAFGVSPEAQASVQDRIAKEIGKAGK